MNPVWKAFRLPMKAASTVAGLLASLGVTRVLASQLFGVSPRHPATLGAVAAVVTLAGLAACCFPAQRATKVDPVVALRYQ